MHCLQEHLYNSNSFSPRDTINTFPCITKLIIENYTFEYITFAKLEIHRTVSRLHQIEVRMRWSAYVGQKE